MRELVLTLQRLPSESDQTHGDLFVDGVWECFTLEDRVREIAGQPVEQWKVRGKTAIPAGRYRMTLAYSQRFGPSTLTIEGVPGFVGIRVHGGNTHEDTEGCPLLGRRRNTYRIYDCKPALEQVKSKVRAAKEQGHEVWIDILNAAAA